jgi:hypothetical protein
VLLAADEGEALAQFEQDVLDPCHECPFQVAFLGVLGNRQEIKLVRSPSQNGGKAVVYHS